MHHNLVVILARLDDLLDGLVLCECTYGQADGYEGHQPETDDSVHIK